MGELCCPFCGYKAKSDYGIMYHFEEIHPEGESSFTVMDTQSENEPKEAKNNSSELFTYETEFVDCPLDGCGEMILLTELDSHIDMHGVEDDDAEDDALPIKRLKISPLITTSTSTSAFMSTIAQPMKGNENKSASAPLSSDVQNSVKASWRELLRMPTPKAASKKVERMGKSHRRLGKSELGPHAHEEQMPAWLRKVLEDDGQAETLNKSTSFGRPPKTSPIENYASGILLVIKSLLHQDSSTEYAYICHPSVLHISKLKKEGGFCGYRNIQMLTSYINGARSQGFHHFCGKIPTIFQIQDFIEHAWDIGINKQGRVETGGIRGTRKYIGTPEAQAMLVSLNIACDAQGLKTKEIRTKDGKAAKMIQADQLLFQYVEDYFSNDCTAQGSKVRDTGLPPLYLQHPGHSLTIIGFEKKTDGATNLLVFDPMFHDAAEVIKHVGCVFSRKNPGELLRAYRRSVKYLRKYNEFELLKLTPPRAVTQGPKE